MSNEQEKVIYSMHRVTKRHGQKEVLKNITLGYFYGAKIGVLGLNGAGKSSLLKILAGVDKNFDGNIVIAPGYSIGYLEQEPLVDETRTVREVVEEGVKEVIDLVHEFNDINAKFAEPMEPEEMDALIDRQAKVQEKMDAMDAWDIDSRLEMAMDALRCPPADAKVSEISGGEKRRVALCRLLLQNPDVLLLDEPTNHLDAESVAWLERFLHTFPGTVISWIMLRAGFWNLTAAKAFHGKAITLHGLSKRKNVLPLKNVPTRKDKKHWLVSLNGSEWLQRADMPKVKPVSMPTKPWSAMKVNVLPMNWKFIFRRDHALATL